MAEAILFTVAVEILRKLPSTTSHQFGLAVGVKHDLKKLKQTLSTINDVLLDAEQKQSTNRPLSHWLQRLQDVLYDADNILDAFAYKAIQQRLATRDNSKGKVRHIFSSVKFRFKMSYKIKKIREKLDQIASDKTQFHLTEGVVDRHVMPREMTYSFVDPSCVIGRDNDKKNIIRLLTSSNIDQNLSVVPIVGIGGLGKTTIVKLVYNSMEVRACFELKMWVCISDDFSLKKVSKEIYRSAQNSDDDCSHLSIDQIQTCLRKILQDKKFLLVLDDVWNELPQKWYELQQLLINGAKGSKLIVTTRSHRVASIMGTTNPYILKELSEEDCWSLFAKCAFREGEEKNYPNLEIIGKQIIKKCKGVPLAVRSLGSMLFLKTEEDDWDSIKTSEIWRLEQNENDILPVLRLSYNQLPSHLKRCFAFCSIFPKDFEFDGRQLIEMWMSQGLIQSFVEQEDLEKKGLTYIKELYSRCFFQDIHYDYNCDMNFKMHDLVHDLALLVAQNECYSINNLYMLGKISEKVRHVSLCITEDFSASSFEVDLSNLWTLYYFQNFEIKGANESFIRTCMPKLKFVRMLDLRSSSFEVLPESIGNLHHLRYLNISWNTHLKKLPDAICKLLHLQTLNIYGCRGLEELPRDIGNLINLRSLRVSVSEIELVPNKQIGLLTSLRDLYISECKNVITTGSSESIECIFPCLGSLKIKRCENLRCWPGIMKQLPALEKLGIEYCEELNLNDELSFPRLRYLTLWSLQKMADLPGWVEGCSNTLRHLAIICCPNLTRLPNWMQKLTSLDKLEIWGCPEISEMPPLPSPLRKLGIGSCPKRCERGGKDWDKIKHIPNITINGDDIRRSGVDIFEVDEEDDDFEINTQLRGISHRSCLRLERVHCHLLGKGSCLGFSSYKL